TPPSRMRAAAASWYQQQIPRTVVTGSERSAPIVRIFPLGSRDPIRRTAVGPCRMRQERAPKNDAHRPGGPDADEVDEAQQDQPLVPKRQPAQLREQDAIRPRRLAK